MIHSRLRAAFQRIVGYDGEKTQNNERKKTKVRSIIPRGRPIDSIVAVKGEGRYDGPTKSSTPLYAGFSACHATHKLDTLQHAT
jgi:hypothetical protein